jgi:hypothetical protein
MGEEKRGKMRFQDENRGRDRIAQWGGGMKFLRPMISGHSEPWLLVKKTNETFQPGALNPFCLGIRG